MKCINNLGLILQFFAKIKKRKSISRISVCMIWSNLLKNLIITNCYYYVSTSYYIFFRHQEFCYCMQKKHLYIFKSCYAFTGHVIVPSRI